MSDDEDETICPLCVEEMDMTDKNFLPCPCGYRVCMWCWHHIRENLNGLCPACRTPYNADPHAFSAVDRSEIVKKNRERKQKEKQEKKVTDKPAVINAKPVIQTIADRRHLHNYRVIQRNLMYVIGVPAAASSDEILKRPEYFGQYGKIGKMVIHRNNSAPQASVSAYVTFVYKDDAKAAIQALDGFWFDGHLLRASFGTTKYCNNFIRGVGCNNPDCVYLHDLGDDDDRFTKEEIQAGHSKLVPAPGTNQTIVSGNGGPSGTGKRPTGEPMFPPPVFLQDLAPATSAATASTQSSANNNSNNKGNSKDTTIASVVRTSSWPTLAAREAEQAASTSNTNANATANGNANASTGTSTSHHGAHGVTEQESISPPESASSSERIARSNTDGSVPSTNSASNFINPSTVISTRNAKVAARKQALEAAQASTKATHTSKTSESPAPAISVASVSPAPIAEVASITTIASANTTIAPTPAMPVPSTASIPVSASVNVSSISSTTLKDESVSAVNATTVTTSEATSSSPDASQAEAPGSPIIGNNDVALTADAARSFALQNAMSNNSVKTPIPAPFPSISSTASIGATSASTNGFGKCAVFPVPMSSLSMGVWASILAVASSDLSVNPYGRLTLPLSELLDLTLPPVDALCMSPWPKPMNYYRQGCSLDGASHSYVGRPMAKTNSWTVEQQQQQQPQILPLSQSYQSTSNSTSLLPSSQNSQSNNNNGPSSNGSMAVLQQMFPSVKVSYGVPAQSSGVRS